MRVVAGNGSFYFVNDANLNAHKAKVSKKKNRDARIASNTKSIEPEATSTDPSMPCVDIRQLVVAVYFYSRGFGPGVADHIIRLRVGVTPDPDFDQKLDSFMRAKFFEEGASYYAQVDEWLNEQRSHEELLELTKFDDYVQEIYDNTVGALVLYIKSDDLQTTRKRNCLKQIWQ